MTKLEQAARQALGALEVATTPLAKDRQEVLRAITTLREALSGVQAQSAPAAAAGPSLRHLHDLLYTAQRTTGDAQAQAIAEARIALSGIMTAQEPAVLASRAWPKVSGVSRDEGHSRTLLVFFAAEPTDDEVRAVHDTLAASPTPPAEQQAQPGAVGWNERLDQNKEIHG